MDPSHGIEETRLDTLDAVVGGGLSSSSARSTLLPARMTERLGEARARASIRKVGREEKDAYEATS